MARASATSTPSIGDLAAATPESRDRYVDFLRAASIVVVMLGHWTMAVVAWRPTGWELGNLLSTFEGGWMLTWVFQVMPVFFFVGGFSNKVTLDSHERRGNDFAYFAASRSWRLLKPVVVLLAIWLPLATAAQWASVFAPDVLRQATTVVTQPLWFIGIYLMVTALAPAMRSLHLRFGAAVPAVLALAAVAVDTVRFQLGSEAIGNVNFAFVWLFAQQLGFLYADNAFQRLSRPVLAIAALASLAVVMALTTFGPYPRSMVGLPGERISNMNPPTACLVALTMWQVPILMLLREPVTRWLQRRRPWTVVVAANSVIMTMFLWHLTALMIASILLLPSGFPQPSPGTPGWWLLRPVWIGILCLMTAIFVLLFGRFERPGKRLERNGNAIYAIIGVILVIVGTCGFAVSGLVNLVRPDGRHLLGLPVSPFINTAALLLGGLFFRLGRSPGQARQ